MISEEKLHEELKKLDDTKYYGYNWRHQYEWLIREYIKLNKEADWLAEKLLTNCEHCGADIFGSCFLRVNNICDTHGRCNGKEKIAPKHWRETARKAVPSERD